MSWPAPLQLAGLKSKKREIFGVKEAVLKVNGNPCEVANVTVNLQSRVFAVGDAGRAVAALLLGKQQPVSGEVKRPYDLTIAHLTPQNAFSTAEDHAAFIADELAKRPQVIVIDEGIAQGGETWAAAFSEILQGTEIQSFKGAVIICCSREEHIAQVCCNTRWVATGSLLRPECVCQGVKFHDDLYAGDPDVSMLPLLRDVEELHVEAFNPAPCVPRLPIRAEESGWTVAAFTALKIASHSAGSGSDSNSEESSDADSNENNKDKLLGYLAYLAFPGLGELHIARLAVPNALRRQGYGTQLIRWACDKASALGLNSVWLYATPDVEPFYERVGFFNMGFKDDDDPDEIDEDRYSWMMLDISAQNGSKEL
eukprot:gnl/MRDRNA2_/MRDRNA2_45369_c0_seq1.p1 gnl/MRDRNA2_/MRDRNA2_45369_c0~~gnl/MRDRNA2_/MRDRNA2_45369_c0_seq1.p1  ORF type:complete len:369 (+),score=79.84 gnl/MRDRNA2_/MRDRNA2_45369_c0_seq1:97-1203(+)